MSANRFQSLSVPELAAWVQANVRSAPLDDVEAALAREWTREDAERLVAALDSETLWFLTTGDIESPALLAAVRARNLAEPALRDDYARRLVGTGQTLTPSELAPLDDAALNALAEHLLSEPWRPAELQRFLASVPPERLASASWNAPFVADLAQLLGDPAGATPALDAELRRRFDETLEAEPYDQFRTQDVELAGTVSLWPSPLRERAVAVLRAMTEGGRNATRAAWTLRQLQEIFHVPVAAAALDA